MRMGHELLYMLGRRWAGDLEREDEAATRGQRGALPCSRLAAASGTRPGTGDAGNASGMDAKALVDVGTGDTERPNGKHALD